MKQINIFDLDNIDSELDARRNEIKSGFFDWHDLSSQLGVPMRPVAKAIELLKQSGGCQTGIHLYPSEIDGFLKWLPVAIEYLEVGDRYQCELEAPAAELVDLVGEARELYRKHGQVPREKVDRMKDMLRTIKSSRIWLPKRDYERIRSFDQAVDGLVFECDDEWIRRMQETANTTLLSIEGIRYRAMQDVLFRGSHRIHRDI